MGEEEYHCGKSLVKLELGQVELVLIRLIKFSYGNRLLSDKS